MAPTHRRALARVIMRCDSPIHLSAERRGHTVLWAVGRVVICLVEDCQLGVQLSAERWGHDSCGAWYSPLCRRFGVVVSFALHRPDAVQVVEKEWLEKEEGGWRRIKCSSR